MQVRQVYADTDTDTGYRYIIQFLQKSKPYCTTCVPRRPRPSVFVIE